MSDASRISRQLSLCAVMETIVHYGPISRASVAKQTGLSKQTISEIARRLEVDGWIRETGRTSGHVGRTAVTYEIVPDAACIAAVDLGGTKARAAIADLSCNVLAEVVEPTDERGGVHVVRQIARMCGDVARHNDIDFEKVRLAVIGVPGVPDPETGRVLMAPNIADFDTFNFVEKLKQELDRDVFVENDVNLAVLGEHWIGTGSGIDDLAYVALGTGIGAGIMVGGELVRGHAHAAGELGFLPFGADPFEPESLRIGALERVTATFGMRERYRQLSGKEETVPAIFDAASAGDDAALTVLDETAKLVARAIAAICAVTGPGRVVLGGSIGSRDEIAERVRAFAPQCYPRAIDITVSSLGTQAAIVGAAATGLSHLHATLFSGGVPGAAIALPPRDVVKFGGARS
ncbi:ROK family transcriptional regulator [Hoeflea sp.]|uniref:ROK family transcriptional regulator n=1 Tax=Hoeflea sp. TaxID=1940281 RepID=UPI003B025CE6